MMDCLGQAVRRAERAFGTLQHEVLPGALTAGPLHAALDAASHPGHRCSGGVALCAHGHCRASLSSLSNDVYDMLQCKANGWGPRQIDGYCLGNDGCRSRGRSERRLSPDMEVWCNRPSSCGKQAGLGASLCTLRARRWCIAQGPTLARCGPARNARQGVGSCARPAPCALRGLLRHRAAQGVEVEIAGACICPTPAVPRARPVHVHPA